MLTPAALKIEGDLPPHWLGNLSSELATLGVDVRKLHAERARGSRWNVELGLGGGARCTEQELLEIATNRRPSLFGEGSSALAISQFHLERVAGTLRLRVVGVDRLGFLAQLCAHLAALALFPVYVDAQTRGEFAVDTLWLRCVGDSEPLLGTELALTRLLQARQRLSSRPPLARP